MQSEIKVLLSRIKKGRIGNSEFDFAERLAVSEIEFEEIDEDKEIDTVISDEAEQEAILDPRGAILNAWIKVEIALRNLLISRGLESTSSSNNKTGATIKIRSTSASTAAWRQIKVLSKSGIVRPEVIALLQELRSMRNDASHQHEFNPPASAVLRYISLSQKAVDILNSVN